MPNHGDQLLVFKQSYLYRTPRRWEVIVFRNPAEPLEAFVKRVIGLPGESIQLVDGDVVIDGELCRKSWTDQRELRIPVHRHKAVTDKNSCAPAIGSAARLSSSRWTRRP